MCERDNDISIDMKALRAKDISIDMKAIRAKDISTDMKALRARCTNLAYADKEGIVFIPAHTKKSEKI